MNGTASTAPEPEAAPEPVAPELIAGRRYRVGPDPTFRIDGEEFEFDAAATVTLANAIPDVDGDVLINDHVGIVSIDPRHLTPLPEDEPTDRDVERDAQVAELARVVAELGRKVDALINPRRRGRRGRPIRPGRFPMRSRRYYAIRSAVRRMEI